MQMLHKYARLIYATGGFALSAGTMWLCYQVHATVNTINNLLRTSCLDNRSRKVEYIYQNEPRFLSIGSPDESKEVFKIEDEPFFITSVIMRWWTTFQKQLAWRFLHLAKTGEKVEKQRAIRSLAQLSVLTDSDYQQLAQCFDAETAVGLARTEGSDLRFFLKPPPFYRKPLSGKEIKEKLLDVLQMMESKHHHSCVDNFLTSYEQNVEDTPGANLSALLEEEVISKSLDVLVHHCSIKNYARDLIEVNALPFLVELCNHFKDSTVMLCGLFTVLSHLSAHEDLVPAFFASGLIGVLAKWSRHPDVRVALPCAKALANLDKNSSDGFTYPDQIFPLHPTYRQQTPYKADIIFVHGLLGTVYITWRQRESAKLELPQEVQSPQELSLWQDFLSKFGKDGSSKVADTKSETPETSHLKTQQYMDQILDLRKEDFDMLGSDFEYILADIPNASGRLDSGPYSFFGDHEWVRKGAEAQVYTNCWARDWLPDDCPSVRVLGISYSTSLSQWFLNCPNVQSRRSTAERAEEFMAHLRSVGVGDRPIIWVTHSMGGLLVKQMLVSAFESGKKDLQSFYRNTKAIVFYSCPHMGSEFADMKLPTEMLIWPSVEVQELRYRSASLVDLHLRFLQLLKVAPMTILSFVETKPTNVTALRVPVYFVRPHSADPGIGEFYEIPLDHIDICKPAGRHSFLHYKVVDLINRVLNTT